MEMQRRDRKGRFIPICRAGRWQKQCTVRAQYGIEGYGWSGLRYATRALYCLRHGRQVVAQLNRQTFKNMPGRSTGYRLVDVINNRVRS